MMLNPVPISPARSELAIEAELRADSDWLSTLPSMTWDDVATLNAFYRRRGAITGTLAGRAITVETGWRPRCLAPVAAPCVLELAVDGERGELVLPMLVFGAIMPTAAHPLAALKSEHAAILLEFILADTFDALEAALGVRVSIIGVRRAQAQARRTESLWLMLTMGDLGSMPCELVLAPHHVRRFAVLLDRLAGQPAAVLDLDLSGCLRVAAAPLTVGALRELAPGDVILAEQACLPDEAAVLVIAEHFLAPVRIEPEGCRLTAPPATGRGTTWEWSMEKNFDASKGWRLEDAVLDTVPIRVIFELGRVELPLAEIAALAPGALVPLARPLDGPLDMVANGKRIGQGMLVRIGDSLGVQVTRLFEHA